MTQHNQTVGKWGEDIAAQYLLDDGYRIIKRNFRALRGEIDIIAQKGNQRVFVEVKSGNSRKYWLPEERVTSRKQQQLYRIAGLYIQYDQVWQGEYRFDVIVVDGHSGKYDIRHYENAFIRF